MHRRQGGFSLNNLVVKNIGNNVVSVQVEIRRQELVNVTTDVVKRFLYLVLAKWAILYRFVFAVHKNPLVGRINIPRPRPDSNTQKIQVPESGTWEGWGVFPMCDYSKLE